MATYGQPRRLNTVTMFMILLGLAAAGISLIMQLVLGLVCLRWATARGLKPQAIEPVAEAAAG
jgi:hypothetical protein